MNHDINSILIEPTFTELPELRSTASLCVKLRNKRRRNALDAAELLLDHRLARPLNWPPSWASVSGSDMVVSAMSRRESYVFSRETEGNGPSTISKYAELATVS